MFWFLAWIEKEMLCVGNHARICSSLKLRVPAFVEGGLCFFHIKKRFSASHTNRLRSKVFSSH
jgi:hypothetical protein